MKHGRMPKSVKGTDMSSKKMIRPYEMRKAPVSESIIAIIINTMIAC